MKHGVPHKCLTDKHGVLHSVHTCLTDIIAGLLHLAWLPRGPCLAPGHGSEPLGVPLAKGGEQEPVAFNGVYSPGR